jgi:hypothetical protein
MSCGCKKQKQAKRPTPSQAQIVKQNSNLSKKKTINTNNEVRIKK